jgi:hypothetical protein
MKAHMLAEGSNLVLPSVRVDSPNSLHLLAAEVRRMLQPLGCAASGPEDAPDGGSAACHYGGLGALSLHEEGCSSGVGDKARGGVSARAGSDASGEAAVSGQCNVGLEGLRAAQSPGAVQEGLGLVPAESVDLRLRLRSRLHLEVLRVLEWCFRLMEKTST